MLKNNLNSCYILVSHYSDRDLAEYKGSEEGLGAWENFDKGLAIGGIEGVVLVDRSIGFPQRR